MASLLPNGKQSFETSAGTPLVGGRLYTYAAGTTTPKATYADAAETTPNTNPVILDARGEATVFWSGAYKVQLRDALDAVIWTVDALVGSDVQFAQLASSAGASLVGYLPAGAGAVATTVQSKLRESVSVFDFMTAAQIADVKAGTLLLDVTSAIEAADAAACSGVVGLDGVTVVANFSLYFPAGKYRVTGLNFRGAPWRGAGMTATFICHHGSSGPAVNAVGSTVARKILSIDDMTLDGRFASGTAHGLRIGHNYRSFGALRRVRIDRHPGPGIWFKENSWSMSFYDVYLSFNGAVSLKTGIYIDGAVTGLLAFDWFNLQLENNGQIGSGVAGGMELTGSALLNWKFYGGVWEGNYGDCEVRFTSCEGMHIYGTYFETDPGSAIDGLVFSGSCMASVYGLLNTTGVGATGKAIVVRNTANVTIDQVRGDNQWPVDIAVQNTATVNLLGEGQSIATCTVASGARLRRAFRARNVLVDAATIAVDASLGDSFVVTLAGNRTMGTPTNMSVGQRIAFTIQQDVVGSRTLAWSGTYNVTWSNTNNGASKRSMVEFEFDGTYLNQVSAQSPYI